MDLDSLNDIDYKVKKARLYNSTESKIKEFLKSQLNEKEVQKYLNYRYECQTEVKQFKISRIGKIILTYCVAIVCCCTFFLVDKWDFLHRLVFEGNVGGSHDEFGWIVIYGIVKYGSIILGVAIFIFLTIALIVAPSKTYNNHRSPKGLPDVRINRDPREHPTVRANRRLQEQQRQNSIY
jgi:hypothetical protein